MTSRKGVSAILGILAVFWVVHLVFAAPAAGMRAVVATLIGGTAYILMAIAIFLAARPGFVESAFGGLDRMYRVHKFCGVSAGLLVLAHFFAAPKSIPEGIDPTGVAMAPSAPLGMISLILLALSLAITLNRKIAYHRWRLPHKAMGVVFLLVTIHFLTAPAIFFDRFGPSGLILIVAGVLGIGAFIYKQAFGGQGGHRYVVEQVNPLERATEIVMRPLGTMVPFSPGQFALVELQAKGFGEPHPFTISSAPGESRLRFTVKVLGDWTRKIREELRPGAEAVIRGPYGRFDPAKAGINQVWLAGGIGITPFLSALRAMDRGDPRSISLVYAVREEKEALFLKEIRDRVAALGNIRLVVLESNKGHFARVDMMKEKLAEPLAIYEFFLCGPKPMVTGLTKDLRAAGVSRDRIHHEEFEFR